ncbi:MAG: HAMP domain-containing histidine kinase, partial [Bacteroidia bacterium]|nr:HAMP domain-containing histidine kinase [Bacteroidia bacterium]
VESEVVSRQDAAQRYNPATNGWSQYDISAAADSSLDPPREIIRIRSKSDVVAYVMDELRNLNKNIEERLNEKLLRSLLKRELENRGIYIDYTFVVENRRSPQQEPVYLFSARKMPSTEVLSSDFQVNLFPTDIFGHQNILHVYFPHQEAYILKNMWWMFGSSLLFIGLVVYCFAQAVSTIIRQKKISEITNDFINNMTHELKTPISTVSLACEAIQDPDIRQLPRQVDRYLNIIKEENERLGNQVERVLQIAVLDRGDFKLKINSIDLHEIIAKAIRNIVIQIENRDGFIQMDLAAPNPVIEADEVHISNVIYNLVDNANKYSPEAPEISIHTRNVPQGAEIEISDRGQGMSKDTINKIFDKFYRIPTGNIHNVKGFGLGLSYVKTMVEAHGGHISVRSELLKGSVFTLFLPSQFVNAKLNEPS